MSSGLIEAQHLSSVPRDNRNRDLTFLKARTLHSMSISTSASRDDFQQVSTVLNDHSRTFVPSSKQSDQGESRSLDIQNLLNSIKTRIVQIRAVLSIVSVSRSWVLVFQFCQDLTFIVCSRRDHLHIIKWIKRLLTLRRRVVNTHTLSVLSLRSRFLKGTVSVLSTLLTVSSVRLSQSSYHS